MSDTYSQEWTALDQTHQSLVVAAEASKLSPEARAALIARIVEFDRNWVLPPSTGAQDYAIPSRWFG